MSIILDHGIQLGQTFEMASKPDRLGRKYNIIIKLNERRFDPSSSRFGTDKTILIGLRLTSVL